MCEGESRSECDCGRMKGRKHLRVPIGKAAQSRGCRAGLSITRSIKRACDLDLPVPLFPLLCFVYSYCKYSSRRYLPLCIYQEYSWGQGEVIFSAAYGLVAPILKITQTKFNFIRYLCNWSFAAISIGGCMKTAL